MRLTKPRVEPVPPEKWTEEQQALLGPFAAKGRAFNVMKTLARHPAALRAFVFWHSYIKPADNAVCPSHTSLPARVREIVILRAGYLCRSGYEFTMHSPIAISAGLSKADIARVKAGADAPGWNVSDIALMRACDELHKDKFITDATWAELSQHFNEKQRMDIVFTFGQYTSVSMFLNSFGVQLDEGVALDPDLKAF